MSTIKIRPALLEDRDSIAKIHVDSWRTTYRGIVPDHYLDRLTYSKRAKLWGSILSDNHSIVYIAEADEHPVAFINFSIDDELKGRISSIYCLEAYQKLGIGKKLIFTAFAYFKDTKCNEVTVHVLDLNNAKHFYMHLGGRIESKTIIEIGGKQLEELTIQWVKPFHL